MSNWFCHQVKGEMEFEKYANYKGQAMSHSDIDCCLQTIHIHYTGIIDINNEMRRILGMSPNAASTDFGSSCTLSTSIARGSEADLVSAPVVMHVTFETGASRFKPLEEAIFVGAGRFILDETGLSAEYRISQVCKGIGSGKTVAAEGAVESGTTSIPP